MKKWIPTIIRHEPKYCCPYCGQEGEPKRFCGDCGNIIDPETDFANDFKYNKEIGEWIIVRKGN